MEEFKQYYKFPLKMWEFLNIKVFTDDDKMAFDWLLPHTDAYQEVKEYLLAKINGEEIKPFQVKKTFYHENGIVYCKFEEGKNAGEVIKVLRVRGWGMLIGVGGYNLDEVKAVEIQDAFTNYCVEMLNKK